MAGIPTGALQQLLGVRDDLAKSAQPKPVTALFPQGQGARGVAALAGSSSTGARPGAPPAVGDDVLAKLMGAIRSKESGGNYSAVGAPTKYGRATGAYQFLDSTWAGYGGFRRAKDAPQAVQDERARQLMGQYLQQFGDPAAVAVAWYGGPKAAAEYLKNPAASRFTKPQAGGHPSIVEYVRRVLSAT